MKINRRQFIQGFAALFGATLIPSLDILAQQPEQTFKLLYPADVVGYLIQMIIYGDTPYAFNPPILLLPEYHLHIALPKTRILTLSINHKLYFEIKWPNDASMISLHGMRYYKNNDAVYYVMGYHFPKG